jgi:hypothetical protein
MPAPCVSGPCQLEGQANRVHTDLSCPQKCLDEPNTDHKEDDN